MQPSEQELLLQKIDSKQGVEIFEVYENQQLEVQADWNPRTRGILQQQQDMKTEYFQFYTTVANVDSEGNNNTEDILPTLSMIQFNELRQLSLNNMNIKNVEALSRLKCPQLEMLSLARNLISSARSLRKLSCPQLKYLHLYENRIQDWSPLSELFTKKTCQIQFYFIEHNTILRYRVKHYKKQMQSFFPLLKVQPNISPKIDPKNKSHIHKIVVAMLNERDLIKENLIQHVE